MKAFAILLLVAIGCVCPAQGWIGTYYNVLQHRAAIAFTAKSKGIATQPTALHSSDRSICLREPEPNSTLGIEVSSSISCIPRELWDSCPSAKHFLSHAWLRSLEESGCVANESGWIPQHLTIRIGDELSGFMPLYIKDNSFGEFVFDDAFADAAYRNQIEYYPKLLSGVPFTPVSCDKILWVPSTKERFNSSQLANYRVRFLHYATVLML